MDDPLLLPDDARRVLDFWFGERAGPAMWFGRNDDTDAFIRQEFSTLVERAARGELSAWESNASGQLALIILLDQFPRNMFRQSARAFAYDAAALKLCLAGLDARADQQLGVMPRAFFYMPLQHQEDLALQERSVAIFARLQEACGPETLGVVQSFYDYALRHRDIIAQFGRFPHRNAVLGRPSSAAEAAFLSQPGSSF